MQQTNGHAQALPATKNDAHAQNAIERQGLDGTSIERQSTQAMVLAEKSREVVRARIMQAVARPRDFYVVREKVLAACRRQRFAEVALYRKPVGKKDGKQQFAVGPSVRFAEEAFRAMGNLDVQQLVVYEDARVRTISVIATDLESNASTSVEVPVEKTVERKFVKDGQVVVGRRINSYGDQVFIVEASEDEFAVKSAAALAKARRNVILQLIPGDLLDEAKDEIENTLENGAVDPASRRKQLIDWFSRSLGITAAQLAEYLGHAVESATSEEMKELQGIGTAIFDKELTWAQALESRKAPAESAGPDGVVATPSTEKRSAAAQQVADKIRRPTQPATGQPQQSAPAAPPATTGEVRAPTEAPAERRAAEPAGSAVGFGLIRDAIDDAETNEDVVAAKAKLDAARATLTLHQVSKLEAALKKAAERLGVKL